MFALLELIENSSTFFLIKQFLLLKINTEITKNYFVPTNRPLLAHNSVNIMKTKNENQILFSSLKSSRNSSSFFLMKQFSVFNNKNRNDVTKFYSNSFAHISIKSNRIPNIIFNIKKKTNGEFCLVQLTRGHATQAFFFQSNTDLLHEKNLQATKEQTLFRSRFFFW